MPCTLRFLFKISCSCPVDSSSSWSYLYFESSLLSPWISAAAPKRSHLLVPKLLPHQSSPHNASRVIKSPWKNSAGPECGGHAKASEICATKNLSSLVSFLVIGILLIKSLGCEVRLLLANGPRSLAQLSKDGLNNPTTWPLEVQLSHRNDRSQGFKDFQDCHSSLLLSWVFRYLALQMASLHMAETWLPPTPKVLSHNFIPRRGRTQSLWYHKIQIPRW